MYGFIIKAILLLWIIILVGFSFYLLRIEYTNGKIKEKDRRQKENVKKIIWHLILIVLAVLISLIGVWNARPLFCIFWLIILTMDVEAWRKKMIGEELD